MSHPDESEERLLLVSALRDDVRAEAAALERVRERVSVTLTQAHLVAVGARKSAAARPPVRRRRAAWNGLAAALMVGTALGAGGHALVSSYSVPQRPLAVSPLQRARAPARIAPRPADSLGSALPTSLPTLLEPAPALRAPAPLESRSSLPAARPQHHEPGLAVELTQLEQARRALVEGNASRALLVLTRERELHPVSVLGQERDALVVQALVAAGRHGEARAMGEQFLSRYPNSLLQGAVQSSLATIP